jgi:hypothetical protein
MPLLDLSEIGDDLAAYLDFHIGEARAARTAADRARAAQAVSAHHEALAIVELLLDANLDGFAQHLARAAQVRLWLLASPPESDAARGRRASYDAPLHAALAAGRFDLARQIASASADAWMPRAEYEDDFCYAHALHGHLLGRETAEVLDRFEAVLDGGTDHRLGLLRALAARDAAGAAASFADWMDDRAQRVEDLKASSGFWDGADPIVYASAFVSIPGLAWLRLLAEAGIPPADEFRACPAMALRAVSDDPAAPAL